MKLQRWKKDSTIWSQNVEPKELFYLTFDGLQEPFFLTVGPVRILGPHLKFLSAIVFSPAEFWTKKLTLTENYTSSKVAVNLG